MFRNIKKYLDVRYLIIGFISSQASLRIFYGFGFSVSLTVFLSLMLTTYLCYFFVKNLKKEPEEKVITKVNNIYNNIDTNKTYYYIQGFYNKVIFIL